MYVPIFLREATLILNSNTIFFCMFVHNLTKIKLETQVLVRREKTFFVILSNLQNIFSWLNRFFLTTLVKIGQNKFS